jgi:hypothetical protein
VIFHETCQKIGGKEEKWRRVGEVRGQGTGVKGARRRRQGTDAKNFERLLFMQKSLKGL